MAWRLRPRRVQALRWQGRSERAHRIAWLVTNGEIPDGHRSDQTYGNRACCRPEPRELRVPVTVVVVAGPLPVAALVTDGRAVGGGEVKLAVLVGILTGVVDALAAEAALAVVLAGWVLVALWSRARGRRQFVLGPVLGFAGLAGLGLAAVLSARGVDLRLEDVAVLLPTGRPW